MSTLTPGPLMSPEKPSTEKAEMYALLKDVPTEDLIAQLKLRSAHGAVAIGSSGGITVEAWGKRSVTVSVTD